MTKLIKAISNCYETCTDAYIHPALAILFCILMAIIGIALGLGITYLMAWCFMYVYNILAQTFNWPTFSIWFWFFGLMVIGWLRKIIFPSKEVEEN